ncbi:MAG: hypothetical protein QJR03_06475 [Sphaerobacter sp.]|nr:hypothetical protein [Sphaerobacter sp.]
MSESARRPWCRRRGRRSAIALLAGSLVLGGCGGSSAEPTSPPAATATAAPASEVLAPTIAAWDGISSVRMVGTLTPTATPGQVVEFTIELIPPDRQHVTITGPDGTFEAIRIAGAFYVNGTWMQLPSQQDLGAVVPVQPEETLADTVVPEATAVQEGPETVNGVPCRVWKVTLPTEGTRGTTTIWGGADAHLPRRMVAETPEGTMTIEYSGYDVGFTIEPPV